MNQKDGTPESQLRVLLVEDNPGDARLIQEMLAEARDPSFDLEHVETLSAGLERLGVGGVDAVLLDLSLPDGQGLDTFVKAHARAPGVPIVVLSGHDDEGFATQAVKKGAQDYLVKGRISGDALVRVIRYSLERKRLGEQLRESQKMRAVGQLATGMTHHFNNIFNVAIGNLELALAGAPETIRGYLETAKANCGRASNIIDQLILFGQTMEAERVPVDAGLAIRSASSTLQDRLDPKVQVTLECPQDLPRVYGVGSRSSRRCSTSARTPRRLWKGSPSRGDRPTLKLTLKPVGLTRLMGRADRMQDRGNIFGFPCPTTGPGWIPRHRDASSSRSLQRRGWTGWGSAWPSPTISFSNTMDGSMWKRGPAKEARSGSIFP